MYGKSGLMIDLKRGDCLELMKQIPDKSIDMVLCNLPYGTTACKWDIVIPFEKLWENYNRIVKDGGVIALFGSEPFSSMLRMSNIDMYRYDWVWEKEQGANFMLCKYQPYKVHENISIFYLDKSETIGRSEKFKEIRNYFLTEKEKSGLNRQEIKRILGNNMASHYFTNGVQFSLPTKENYKKLQSTGYFQKGYKELKEEFNSLLEGISTYNPQMTKGKPYVSGNGTSGDITGNITKTKTVNSGTRYPRSIQFFKTEKSKGSFHPTQKPVDLLEYLIRTYTNEGEAVLDNCMGSGSTGVACVNTGRNFIGIELDEKYFETAKKRIEEAQQATTEQ